MTIVALVVAGVSLLLTLLTLAASYSALSDERNAASAASEEREMDRKAIITLQGQLRRDRDEFADRINAHLRQAGWRKPPADVPAPATSEGGGGGDEREEPWCAG